MLLADADPFLKPPSVYDVAGLLIGLLSIWIAVLDIRRRIRAARTEVLSEVARQAREAAFASARHALELTRESAATRSWRRASVYAAMAADQIGRIDHGILPPNDCRMLLEAQDDVRRLSRDLGRQPREGAGQLSDEMDQTLNRAVRTVGRLEMRTGSHGEGD